MLWTRMVPALVVLACGEGPLPGATADGSPGGPRVAETVRVAGAETLAASLLPALARSFEEHHQGVRVEVAGGGTGHGFAELLDGRIDLAAASRAPHPAEQEQARALGHDLRSVGAEHLIAVDVVALAAHRDSLLEALSYDQVIGVFCTGKIRRWEDLGLPAGPIVAVTPEPSSGTRALFEDFFCGPDGLHPSVGVRAAEQIGQALLEDPQVLTYVSVAGARGKLVGLKPTAEDQAVAPTQQNLLRGAYPLYRDLFLYARGEPQGLVAAFLEHIRSPAGQEIVDEERFVPLFLRPERMNEPRPLREVMHFEQDSDQLTARSLTRLEVLVSDLRDRTSEARHVILEGYTDALEEDAVALSQARAEAVQALLEARLPGLFVEVIPRAAERPMAPNTTPYGRQRNRRVQIYLASEEGYEPVVSATRPPLVEEAAGE
jgi:phosphate transport system substrate-binding protein